MKCIFFFAYLFTDINIPLFDESIVSVIWRSNDAITDIGEPIVPSYKAKDFVFLSIFCAKYLFPNCVNLKIVNKHLNK